MTRKSRLNEQAGHYQQRTIDRCHLRSGQALRLSIQMNRLTEWIEKSKDRPLEDPQALRTRIIEALREIYDPEIPVNIYEIGLIYDIDIDPASSVKIRMTLTSPACPVAGTLPGEVEAKVASVAGVSSAQVELVWDPAWSPAKMSEAAKLQLGMLSVSLTSSALPPAFLDSFHQVPFGL